MTCKYFCLAKLLFLPISISCIRLRASCINCSVLALLKCHAWMSNSWCGSFGKWGTWTFYERRLCSWNGTLNIFLITYVMWLISVLPVRSSRHLQHPLQSSMSIFVLLRIENHSFWALHLPQDPYLYTNSGSRLLIHIAPQKTAKYISYTFELYSIPSTMFSSRLLRGIQPLMTLSDWHFPQVK